MKMPSLPPGGIRLVRTGLFLIFLFCLNIWTGEARATPNTMEDLEIIKNSLTFNPVRAGGVVPINQPRYVKARQAEISMNSNDVVFVVFFPDGPRIYPQKIMVWHQVLNERINDKSYSLTYSPLSGSLAAYRTDTQKGSLAFELEGRVYNSSNVLMDRMTGSLWLQFMGLAIDGPLAGSTLEHLPVWWTTWKLATKAYPDAGVLLPPRGSRKTYGRDPYGSYLKTGTYYDNDQLLSPVVRLDKRLPPKNRMLGIEYQGRFLAVDEAYVREKQVVNFFMGEVPMVAVLDPRLDVVRVFERRIWGKEAFFRMQDGYLVDMDSESIWSWDGKALSGRLRDARMDEFFGIYAFWFAWAAFHPETELVPGPTLVPESALVRGDPQTQPGAELPEAGTAAP